jgi:hypothetical protein
MQEGFDIAWTTGCRWGEGEGPMSSFLDSSWPCSWTDASGTDAQNMGRLPDRIDDSGRRRSPPIALGMPTRMLASGPGGGRSSGSGNTRLPLRQPNAFEGLCWSCVLRTRAPLSVEP